MSHPAAGPDHFAEAVRQLERASTERERLRSLEAVRASMQLELRDHARARLALKAPDPEQLAQLEANLRQAWEAYQRVGDAGMDHALRALAGVREALGQLRAATAMAKERPSMPVELAVGDGPGTIVAWPGASWEQFWAATAVPEEFRGPRYRTTLKLAFRGEPDVLVHTFPEGKLVWAKHGAVDRGPRPRRALLDEEWDAGVFPNGH